MSQKGDHREYHYRGFKAVQTDRTRLIVEGLDTGSKTCGAADCKLLLSARCDAGCTVDLCLGVHICTATKKGGRERRASRRDARSRVGTEAWYGHSHEERGELREKSGEERDVRCRSLIWTWSCIAPKKRGRGGDVQILGLELIDISGKLACYFLRTTVPDGFLKWVLRGLGQLERNKVAGR